MRGVAGSIQFDSGWVGESHLIGGDKSEPETIRLKTTTITNHTNTQRDRLLFFSIHLSPPSGPDAAFYPPAPSGAADDVAHNIYNVPLTPLWALLPVRGVRAAGPWCARVVGCTQSCTLCMYECLHSSTDHPHAPCTHIHIHTQTKIGGRPRQPLPHQPLPRRRRHQRYRSSRGRGRGL